MNGWVVAIANYSLTSGFEELLVECVMTGSCVFLLVELMYLGAVYLRCLPCHTDCREKTKLGTRACEIIRSIILSPAEVRSLCSHRRIS